MRLGFTLQAGDMSRAKMVLQTSKHQQQKTPTHIL